MRWMAKMSNEEYGDCESILVSRNFSSHTRIWERYYLMTRYQLWFPKLFESSWKAQWIKWTTKTTYYRSSNWWKWMHIPVQGHMDSIPVATPFDGFGNFLKGAYKNSNKDNVLCSHQSFSSSLIWLFLASRFNCIL